jgi:hypothetical protein
LPGFTFFLEIRKLQNPFLTIATCSRQHSSSFKQDSFYSDSKIITPKELTNFTAKPNFYFVLFDGYPGFKTLHHLFNFDNSQHKRDLEARGFYVKDSMRSNYNYTLAAMTSLFNLSYVNRKNSMPINDFSFMYRAQNTIDKSAVAQHLISQDYQIHNLSLFSFAGNKGAADYINYFSPLELVERNFFHNFFLRELAQNNQYKELPLINYYAKSFDRFYFQNEKILNDCIEQAGKNANSFTYAHLLLPHEPYLTDSLGNLLSKRLDNSLSEKEGFVQYTQYANKVMLRLADEITKRDSSAHILFLSDHGYRDNSEENKLYSFDNFMALKTPSKNYEGIEKLKSNINIFPYLFNTFCGQSINYAADSTFYIHYKKNIFERIE